MTQTRPAEEPAEVSGASKRARTAGSKAHDVTEEEAALYDRQIRLWGLEAQSRIRKAHVLVQNIQGLATEAIKNIVLSGIGSLTIVDANEVAEEDLSSGFFYRGNDVGKLRVDAAAARIQNLNPLVKINTLSDASVLKNKEKLRAMALDVIVATSGNKEELVALNKICRELSLKFYVSQAQGLGGWLFSDLGDSAEYVVERSANTGGQAAAGPPVKKKFKYSQRFVPLNEALAKEWKGMNERKLKRLKLSAGFFGTLALWETPEASPSELRKRAEVIMEAKGVDPSVADGVNDEFYQSLHVAVSSSSTASASDGGGGGIGDFAPTTAVLGGLLGQAVLNGLGGREEPIVNWLQLDSLAGQATIHNLGAGEPKLVV
ncbi:hypothetical protein K437DRAFT_254905 [Tilletiaria anomala UBC 951]|uniref:Ubiquitin-like 1-activating enzyme E1A n=1 Tax=Tilletiaria anomala (strain ATCC 24038 / CBS 436.72 / UBC 951) TaxID=1037660 RepID=A0A066WFM9_TILAU|nr:uncharacterized protein K437DRAFT_254905 [Tilletiaria anomala UBC 951]KDN51318.1 hypothetical protein K437DRAFT_254905 [Tilletiaria anomala UBC 951]